MGAASLPLEIKQARLVLEQFEKNKTCIDRNEVIAHALLSALHQHWPSHSTERLNQLLQATIEIKKAESSRWFVQRRIALAKLSRYFTD